MMVFLNLNNCQESVDVSQLSLGRLKPLYYHYLTTTVKYCIILSKLLLYVKAFYASLISNQRETKRENFTNFIYKRTYHKTRYYFIIV